MSAYITQAQVNARISLPDLISALDDANPPTNQFNQTLFNALVAAASGQVDRNLAQFYQTPFNPPPPAVVDATLTIFCYMLYQRRLTPEEKNIFATDYRETMAWLKSVREGQIGLDVNTPRAFNPVISDTECLTVDTTTA